MYSAIWLILLATAAWLVLRGAKKKSSGLMGFGVILAIATVVFFKFLGFWADVLWFDALGAADRFWTEVMARALLALGGAVFGALLLTLLTRTPAQRQHNPAWASVLVGGGLGGFWGYQVWDTTLKFFHAGESGVTDPILHMDTGFYLFRLPWYKELFDLVFFLVLMALVWVAALQLFKVVRGEVRMVRFDSHDEGARKAFESVYRNAGVFLLVIAAGRWLARYNLMYSKLGAVQGPGWTDVQIRMPALLILTVLFVLLAVVLFIPGLRVKLGRLLPGRKEGPMADNPHTHPLLMAGLVGIFFWFLGLALTPFLLQWLRVEPNEITFERPYIANNIEFTRRAFRLHDVEEKEFAFEAGFGRETVREYSNIFDNVRLWDYRALDAVYKQFQEIRLYYEFHDVDIDRYTIDSTYRQVMVSAREMNADNLPAQSQTFVNKRFKYTHGYGVTLTTVNEFTENGLPKLLIKDIPPKSASPELVVQRPEIYYGDLTYDHVVVNTEEAEFDYPSGEENVYTRYEGKGGVQMTNVWRKFLFGYVFDGTRLFLSDYPTPESRIMFRRQIRERVDKLAPFLSFDEDPYIVLDEGKLYWIIDAYTTSDDYPYSEAFSLRDYKYDYSKVPRYLQGVNYMRNSVKVVVDAYNGDVDFYIFDPEDEIIQVWQEIFPDLFKAREEMPDGLEKHVRYPSDFLLAQGLIYTKYHMTDPTVFYNQEDLWVRATEKYYSSVQPVEPYYIMWALPESDRAEFTLMMPFTPKNRQVLIGWIAGMSDGENYGRFLAYKFPKEQRIIGPQQVETKIDQDRFLSGQLSLWDQRGSSVIRGNVLAIPVANHLFYVEPIYLQAETAAYPELRLVVVMEGDNMSYAESFDKALAGLFEQIDPALMMGRTGTLAATQQELIAQATKSFNDYLRHQGEADFDQAARAMKQLQQALQQLSDQASEENNTQEAAAGQ